MCSEVVNRLPPEGAVYLEFTTEIGGSILKQHVFRHLEATGRLPHYNIIMQKMNSESIVILLFNLF